MPIAITGNGPVEIVVDARLDTQQIVNKFYLKCTTPGAAGQDMALLLANWVDRYRLTILSFHYTPFSVFRYTMREIVGIRIVGVPPDAHFASLYSVENVVVQPGAGADTGATVLAVGEDYLPAHEALRAFKAPEARKLHYFKSNYNRFAGFSTAEKDPVREIWSNAALTGIDVALGNFNAAAIASNVAGTITWKNALWSPAYYGSLDPKPQPYGGSLFVSEFKCDKYVGTQISRRFSPSGQYKGR